MFYGPMFERAKSKFWESNKEGAHYNIYRVTDDDLGMDALRKLFPEGKANEFSFCLFSTSGIHGSSLTLEDLEQGEGSMITFLIVQPSICCLRYGNCYPKDNNDIIFLRALRESSFNAVLQIGMPEK